MKKSARGYIIFAAPAAQRARKRKKNHGEKKADEKTKREKRRKEERRNIETKQRLTYMMGSRMPATKPATNTSGRWRFNVNRTSDDPGRKVESHQINAHVARQNENFRSLHRKNRETSMGSLRSGRGNMIRLALTKERSLCRSVNES